jgi:acyl carrier protein
MGVPQRKRTTTLEEQVLCCVNRLNPNQAIVVTLDTPLVEQLGFDSALMLSLMLDLEAAFDIHFKDADLVPEHFAAARSIIQLLGEYVTDARTP